MKIKTLSIAQTCFLRRLRAHPLPLAGDRCPFLGNRDAGRAASAWHRTATSLEARGLVRLERSGDSKRAFLTDKGYAMTDGALKELKK
jgi:hypothetical protein